MTRFPSRLAVALASCVAGVASGAQAQDVTISAASTTPLVGWIWGYVGGTSSYSQPAGPLAISGTAGLWSFFSSSQITWNQQATPSATTFSLSTLFSGGNSLGAASRDPFSIVLDLSSSSPRAIELDLERLETFFGSPSIPTVAIDIGNDGSVEYADVPVTGVITIPGLTAGPTPLQVGISWSGGLITSAHTGGNVNTELLVTVRPDNDVTMVKEVAGCLPGQPGLEEPLPVFADSGVDLHFAPGLLVASTQSTPTVWGPNSPLPFATQCLLVPQPDILIWLPSGFAHIALPPALRPVQFHVQVVFISAVGIVASDGYQVTAN